MGARPGHDGLSGVHTHMTNSLNTPTEVLEITYPVRVRRYGFRRGSGGAGKYRGGDGIVREIEFLVDAHLGVLSERRAIAPYGLAGGSPGAKGKNELISRDGRQRLASKCSAYVRAGDAVRIETPGGGGWGKGSRDESDEDRSDGEQKKGTTL